MHELNGCFSMDLCIVRRWLRDRVNLPITLNLLGEAQGRAVIGTPLVVSICTLLSYQKRVFRIYNLFTCMNIIIIQNNVVRKFALWNPF